MMQNYCKLILSIFFMISTEQIISSDDSSSQKIKMRQAFEKMKNQKYDGKISLDSSLDIHSDETVLGDSSYSDTEGSFYSCDSDDKSVNSEKDVSVLPSVRSGGWCKDESGDKEIELPSTSKLQSLHLGEEKNTCRKNCKDIEAVQDIESTDL